jgi:hypothetical protein
MLVRVAAAQLARHWIRIFRIVLDYRPSVAILSYFVGWRLLHHVNRRGVPTPIGELSY